MSITRPAETRPARSAPIWLTAGVLLACTACGSPDRTDARRDFSAAPAVCPAGPERPSGTVDPSYATIGPSSNAIRRSDRHFWIVESGANTVSRLDRASGRLDEGFIDVGNGRNPYDVAVDAERQVAWVTNNLSHTVTVADAASGGVLAEIDDEAFDNPAGIALSDERAWVTNFELSGGEYGPGLLTVVDREAREVVASFETRWKNPSYARRIDTPDGPRIAVTDVGVLTYDGEAQRWRPQSPAGLELWRPGADLEAPARETYELGYDATHELGAPGRPLPAPDGDHLYVTSAVAPVVFTFDLREGAWERSIDDPIRLYEADGDTLHHGAFGPDGLLYVTAFNRDAMYLLDPSCDEPLGEPIEIGGSEELLEGPHGVAVQAGGEGLEAYYLLSPAHALGRIRLNR